MNLRLLIGLLFSVLLIAVLFLFFEKPDHDFITLFPIQNYSQNITDWVNSDAIDYNKPLLTDLQQKVLEEELYRHYFSTDSDALSPWNPNYINQIFSKKAPDDLATLEQEKIEQYNNKNKPEEDIGYGENFRPYSEEWINRIAQNINLRQFQNQQYNASRRGIAIANLDARILPTEEVHFYSHKLAGEGYPFDNLQGSALWVGTPVYILGETLDQAWYMVLTPDFYIAWVRSFGIAHVDDSFITEWQQRAKKDLVAVAQTDIPVADIEDGIYRFSGYVGMIFPLEIKDGKGVKILIPTMDEKHQAHIRHAYLSENNATIMPYPATIRHFLDRMKALINRPYGWGNLYFYNDCSAELKNLYASFGIWLPRHSSEQVKLERVAGQQVDLSNMDVDKRIDSLSKGKHAFMTIVYIGNKDSGGHVFMYLGNYFDPKTQAIVPLTYQNIWGLAPKPAISRAVIGEAVLLPLLKTYPEDPSLSSLADKKHFKIMYLDNIPSDMIQYRSFEFNHVDLRILLSP